MLGTDCMKRKIPSGGFCCCLFFFSTCIVGLGYAAGRGMEGGGGGVKVRGKQS